MFDDYFDVYLADTAEGREEHFKLRYQVYCEEMGFEDKNNFSSEQEKDRWDDNAVHFLVRHKETKQWVGAMRMVFKQDGALPLQEHCSLNTPHESNNIDIEISRLCLVKEIRRRKTDEEPPLGLNGKADMPAQGKNVIDFYNRRKINQSLIWGLFRAASIYSEEKNIDNWYFLSTKALARIISRVGAKMSLVGNGCHYRGERYPFKIDLNEVLSNDIWTNDFKKGYRLFSELDDEVALPQEQAA
ncbi:PEP-CTERM/exosortase system-associated acyltransferase [Methylomarinum vadi]|uniref:PEP-CTERM/exosortase system-associated acyltransferase n=1 Tax=Methylomarinum vadi TaxID=438855 RepID=UPI00068D83C5|nr:PEP-CTERM/exosortase system-associated acyltransferase [Methylomarinum vadi]